MIRLYAFALLVMLVVGPAFGQTPGQAINYFGGKLVSIDVTQPWTSTGITCAVGDTLYLSLRGVWSASVGDPGAWCGPDGNGTGADSRFPVPTAAVSSVIGKVGTSGVGFFVGAQRAYFADVAGVLYLGVNDILTFSDNGGTLIAYILRQRNHIIPNVAGTNNNPVGYALGQNYPNPFNPSTTIEYEVAQQSNVEIRIYNSVGQLVKSLLNENLSTGTHQTVWDGTDDNGAGVASGSYFYQIRAGEFTQAKKALLLK